MKKETSTFLVLAFSFITTYISAQPKFKPEYAEKGKEVKHGAVVTEKLTSTILRDNRVGLTADRMVKVYLPPGYANSGKSYPVIYYFHNLNRSAEKMFEDGNLVKLLESGFANGMVRQFILIAADYSMAGRPCWYENSTVTGRWLDFTVDEVIPFIDKRFRTLQHRDSRGLAGDFVGGRGALVLAMLHPDIFSVVYALHPVATGTGPGPMASKVNWEGIHKARSLADLQGDGFARPFISIFQAFLPNPNRAPFHCDFMVEMENGHPKLHLENTKKLKAGFLLDHMLDDGKAANLRSMHGIAFDWSRYDPNQDHVFANQAFTRKLDELGIAHEAEEYLGDPWNKNWIENGRFHARLLPFLNRYLVFGAKAR